MQSNEASYFIINHHQYHFIGKNTNIPLLTQPQKGYDKKNLP